MRDDDTPPLSRRTLFGTAAGLGALALAPGETQAAMGKGPDQLSLSPDGTYATVPLAKESWMLGVVQSRVVPVDIGNLKATRKANLDHMLRLIDAAAEWGAKPDLLFFHEFPITGWRGAWTRKDLLRVCIEIPGEETEAVAAKAKALGSHIVFGSYARDPAWPDHVLSITCIMGPDGTLVDKHWKARNIKGVFGGGIELFTTTIYDVLDRYVEMYGRDAVVPVTRTPLGNICTSSIQREPEYFRAMAMKGAEVILRTATGGFTRTDIEATSLYNGVYTAICNNAISPDTPFFEDTGAGGSAIFGPDGKVLDEASSPNETLVSARIPIGQFRARHRQPILHKELYMAEFEGYRPRYEPNLFSQYLPTDLKDSARYLADKSKWK